MSESEDSLVDSAKRERNHHHLRDYHNRLRLDSMTDSGTDTETREMEILQVRTAIHCFAGILILELHTHTQRRERILDIATLINNVAD